MTNHIHGYMLTEISACFSMQWCYFNAYCLTPGWLMRFSNLTTLHVNKHQKITKAKAGLVLSCGSSFTAHTVLAPACCDDYRNVP